jgi:hypothetical protein
MSMLKQEVKDAASLWWCVLFFFSSGDLKDVDIGQNVQYAE